MKPHSNTRMFVEYVTILFGSYLLISLVIALIGAYNYREILCSPFQMYALVLIYWWIPIPRMIDLDQQNL